MDYINKKYTVLDILMLFAILLSGSDIWGVELFGTINVRYVQILYVFITLILVCKNKYKFVGSQSLLIFFIVFILATILSIDMTSSILFAFWMVYNYFFIVNLFYSYIVARGIQRFIDIFRYSLFIIFILSLISSLLSNGFAYDIPFFSYQHHLGISRTALWFFEPSYLATFLTIYLGFSFSQFVIAKKKNYIYDIIFSVISICLTTSTTGFVAIAIAIAFSFTYKIIKARAISTKIKYLAAAIAFLAVIFGVIYIAFPHLYTTFIERLFSQGIESASGDRVRQYSVALQMFLDNLLFGIGPNCYGVYLGDATIQPTNVTLELLATTGIFGAISFYCILLIPIFKAKNSKSFSICVGVLLFLIILQANQNYMRLYLWMCIGIVYAVCDYKPIKVFSAKKIPKLSEQK